MIQLRIESFLIEAFVENAKVKVRRAIKKVSRSISRLICSDQLWIAFPKDPMAERYRVKTVNGWEWRERTIDMKEKKHGKVGSPVPMRTIKKEPGPIILKENIY